MYFLLLQELPDVPLFLSLHNLCATLKCTSPSAIIFRSAVINAGYRISGTHVNPLGLKSDAPMEVIWDIMRCWVRRLHVACNTDICDCIQSLLFFQMISGVYVLMLCLLFVFVLHRLTPFVPNFLVYFHIMILEYFGKDYY